MDPATICCPNPECPASGPTGQGNLCLHSRKAQRCICRQCHKPCTATKGTAFSRLRTSAENVSLVVTLLAHGCPLHAIVVACGFDERTVAAWWVRAGRQGRAVQEPLVEQPRDLGQVPADEIRVTMQGGSAWMALAILVKTRLGLAGEVSTPRDLTLLRRLRARVHAWALQRPRLFCPAGVCASIRAMREPCRDPVRRGAQGRPRLRPWRTVGIAQGVKRYALRRLIDVERRSVQGTPARVETLRRRAQGPGVINTADLERRNATFRARLVLLTRRGRALARRPLPVQPGMYLLGSVYNFCPYQASLRLAASAVGMRGITKTPAMAAGITNHCWTVQELLSFQVPPPRWTPPQQRGRPSQARPHLIERWCS